MTLDAAYSITAPRFGMNPPLFEEGSRGFIVQTANQITPDLNDGNRLNGLNQLVASAEDEGKARSVYENLVAVLFFA